MQTSNLSEIPGAQDFVGRRLIEAGSGRSESGEQHGHRRDANHPRRIATPADD